MKLLQLSSLVITLLLSVQQSGAQTPYAAEINYRSLGNNQYAIELEVFRQCSATPPANQLSIHYRSSTCGINNSLNLQQTSVTDITPTCPSGGSLCALGKGFLHCIYSDTLTLTQCSDWEFSYSECCRDSIIYNIESADTSSIFTQTSLDNSVQDNNSAILTGDGYVSFCINTAIFYYPHAYDLDGDSLSFSLVSALGMNGTSLTYSPGFSGITPAGPTVVVNIDPTTGDITFFPTTNEGLIISIQVDEFRNGVLIASSYKDRTFVSNNCPNSSRPFLHPNSPKIENIQGGYLLGNIFYVDDPVQLSFDLPVLEAQDSIQLSSDITATNGNYAPLGGSYQSTGIFDTLITNFTWQKSSPPLQEFMISVSDSYCDTFPPSGFRIGFAIIGIECLPQPIQATVCTDSAFSFCPTCQSGTLLNIDTIFSPTTMMHGTLSLDSNNCIQYLAGSNAAVQDSFWVYFGGNGGTWMDSMWVDITTISCLLAKDKTIQKTALVDNIRLYPNPTKDKLQIHSVDLIQVIHIYDLTGRHLKTIPSNKKEEQLDFSPFELGIYILKIQTTEGVYSKKVQHN